MKQEQYIYINKGGDRFYYKDEAMTVLHRDDGPAIEQANGDKIWYLNDNVHRENGPAIEYADGGDSWYLNDEALTKEQFEERMNPVVVPKPVKCRTCNAGKWMNGMDCPDCTPSRQNDKSASTDASKKNAIKTHSTPTLAATAPATPCSRCIVRGCENHKHQGRFVGDLCAPCHEYITIGRIGPTTSFLGRIDKALDALKVISVADWKTAGELRKMAHDAYSSANEKHLP